jgi:hypothetical protein
MGQYSVICEQRGLAIAGRGCTALEVPPYYCQLRATLRLLYCTSASVDINDLRDPDDTTEWYTSPVDGAFLTSPVDGEQLAREV